MAQKTCILGSGAMGIACAWVLNETAGHEVSLWGHNPQHIEEIQVSRENRRQLPQILIPESIQITGDIQDAVADADLIVVAIPSAFLRDALSRLVGNLPSHLPVVSVVKGMENSTFLRPSEIIAEILRPPSIAILAGPSHAEEICRRLPTSVVAASTDLELASHVQTLFTTDRFRVYRNPDVVGVELAGALKNVIAIAAGICDGLGYGDNAKAALVSRGLAEMTRFGQQLQASVPTFSGLAGLGDLVTTCFSKHGRNRAVGERLGRGETLAQILASMKSVAEGVPTSRSIHELSLKLQIEMPITSEVYRVLFEDKSPSEATAALMTRPLRDEL